MNIHQKLALKAIFESSYGLSLEKLEKIWFTKQAREHNLELLKKKGYIWFDRSRWRWCPIIEKKAEVMNVIR